MFEGVKGFAETPSIIDSDLEIVDPKVENEKVAGFDVISIITCTIIAFFVLMTTVATFLLWSKTKDALKL